SKEFERPYDDALRSRLIPVFQLETTGAGNTTAAGLYGSFEKSLALDPGAAPAATIPTMKRRAFLEALAAAGVVSASMPAARAQQAAASGGRIKQGLWQTNFGESPSLSFDDMCR